MTRPAPWPTQDEEDRLLTDLRSGDRSAHGPVAAAYLEPLIAELGRRHRFADPHAVASAAGEAIVNFLKDPTKYDPTRGPFRPYLEWAATRDLQNLLARERRHQRGRVSLAEDVEDRPTGGNSLPDGAGWDDPRIVAALAELSPTDRRVFDLMKDEVPATAAYVGLLGVVDEPPDVQARAVKRAKDRIKARLRRATGDE